MKKRSWLKMTIITLVACGVAGVVLALILFNANPGRTGASASITFSFDGAAEGLAPNGTRYDLSALQSDEVLNAALEETGLAEKYTPDQLRSNLIISGVYPEDIVDQMTSYQSLLTGDAGKISLADYHATLYNVTLYNDFDKGISRENLENLLGTIMKDFREVFLKTYSAFLAKDSMLDNLSEYDYTQQLEILDGTISRNAGYAQEMAKKHSEFLVNGVSFADIAVRFENLKSVDLERIGGMVTMNALSRNPDRLIAQYENQIKVLQIRLKEMQKESENVEGLISQYNKDDIIYVSTSETLQRVGSNAASTYDALVARHQEIADNIAELNKELAQVQLKLSDIRGETETESQETAEGEGGEETAATAESAAPVSEEEREAQKAVVEKNIDAVVAKYNTITEDFANFLKEYSDHEMNERTVSLTAVRYTAPKILSGSFAVRIVKTAGPLCVLGLLVCLMIMIISERKAEKKKK